MPSTDSGNGRTSRSRAARAAIAAIRRGRLRRTARPRRDAQACPGRRKRCLGRVVSVLRACGQIDDCTHDGLRSSGGTPGQTGPVRSANCGVSSPGSAPGDAVVARRAAGLRTSPPSRAGGRSARSRPTLARSSTRSAKTSAWRRSSSATIAGWLAMVETTVTRTPRRCTASTSDRKSPSPENRIISSSSPASSMAWTASSMSMLPLILRRPEESTNSLVGPSRRCSRCSRANRAAGGSRRIPDPR